jgi:prolyl-tRNA synthetase
MYVDHAAGALGNFVCGANKSDQHLINVNWGRDLPAPEAVDIRNVVAGDPSPSGKGTLAIARGIEVGHVFQLGQKYSAPMQATVLDEQGKAAIMYMGCYGIGVTRVVAAAIEQNHDERGIIWPDPLAPFTVSLIPINLHKSMRVRETTEQLYAALTAAGIDVVCDDRDLRPGVKFADDELLGIPHRFTIGEKSLDRGMLEYRARRGAESIEVPIAEGVSFLHERLLRGLAAP